MERLGQFIEQSGRSILAHRLVGLCIVLALGAFVLVWLVVGKLLVALVAGLLRRRRPVRRHPP